MKNIRFDPNAHLKVTVDPNGNIRFPVIIDGNTVPVAVTVEAIQDALKIYDDNVSAVKSNLSFWQSLAHKAIEEDGYLLITSKVATS